MKRCSIVGIVAFAGAACASTTPVARSPDELVCPPGTERADSSDSDNGWGYVGQTFGCARPDHVLHGPVIELVESAPGQPPLKLMGHYANGNRVGTWTILDEKSGTELGRFTLDEMGSGVEVIRDQLGHVLRGRVVNGKREGAWTYHDRDGSVVATQVWSHDHFVRQTGSVPWDPPMIDPSDKCDEREVPEDVDGCPDADERAK